MPNPIQVYKSNGQVIDLFKREPVTGVTKAEHIQDLLGQDFIRLTVESAEPIDFSIGDTILIFGKTFRINQIPAAAKESERHLTYVLVFEGTQYELRDVIYFNTDVSGFNTSVDFPLTGNIEMFLDVLIHNANRVFPGKWIKGEVPSTPVKTITFSENNSLSALQQFCKEFEQEFDIVQGSGGTRTIHIRKAGEVLGHIYEYGRGHGLYKLKREAVGSSDIVNRLYAYGSSKNIRSDYRNFSQKLKLPNADYIEDISSIAAFGVKEGSKTFDDIYPHRTGTISSVNSSLSFVDSSMNFDLNAKNEFGNLHLIIGNNAKIHFNTGNLAGYEFELLKYDHSTKTFTLIQSEEEKGLKLPSEEHLAFQLGVGDQYVILDIIPPATYVETAELELAARAQLWLDQVKAPRVQYSLEVDEMYLMALHSSGSIVNVFSIGDYIQIKDDELGIDKSSRVISMTRDVLHPYKYSLTIDDTYQVTFIQKVLDTQKEVKTIIKTGNLKDPNRARMGWLTTQELLRKIFDTDGYFDGGKIKPETVETMALVVGAKSQQFILQDIVFEPNFEGHTNVVHVSSGLLVHYAIAETIKTWFIEETAVTIEDNASRYIYAKVSKTNEEGYIIFSTEQILPDEDASFYHFLIGLLHTAIDGVRWISLTYGATAINGRFVKTGRIQSFDGSTYFDLDLGVIAGYIRFRDSQGNYRDMSDIGAETDMFWKMAMINSPESYIAGFATNWFQQEDPAIWPSGEEDFHEGDNWYNTDSGTLWRRNSGAWVQEMGIKENRSFALAYTRVGNNGQIRTFTAQPVGPYSENDLWMSPNGLLRSIGSKTTGFDTLHWVIPFNFDNTETAINGGVLTSGTIQLAGDNHTVLAGVSGKGVLDTSVRFWAGSSFENRDAAPFRVNQAGEVYGRTRIEVEGVDTGEVDGYKGQAGLAGSETEDKTGIRIYAGSDWEGKESAPFRVDGAGYMRATKGKIGGLTISGPTLANMNEDGTFDTGAQIVFRDDPNDVGAYIGTNVNPASEGGGLASILLRLENNQVREYPDPDGGAPIKEGSNICSRFQASGALVNYANVSDIGIAMQSEALLNGRRTLEINLISGVTSPIDPRGYDTIICNYGNGAAPGIRFEQPITMNPYYYPIRPGKEITIISNNDVRQLFIMNIIQGDPSANIPGGGVLTLIYTGSVWRVKALHDNNW